MSFSDSNMDYTQKIKDSNTNSVVDPERNISNMSKSIFKDVTKAD